MLIQPVSFKSLINRVLTWFTTNRSIILVIFASLFSFFLYLFVGTSQMGWGYPLDDAWIHQTYARNLAYWGQWAFIPGIVSGGSTSPLWTGLISLGYLIGIPHFIWTFFLGWILLFGVAVTGQDLFDHISSGYRLKIPWVGLFLAFEWHLVWASLSGMETLLSAMFVLIVFLNLVKRPEPMWPVGGWIGLSVWCRPDGLLLAAPVGMLIWLRKKSYKDFWKDSFHLVLGIAVGLIPYLVFNLFTQGAIFPGTFYAKQAEYAEMASGSVLNGMLDQLMQPLIGAGALLAPGALYAVFRLLREKNWVGLSLVAWILSYAFLYAWKLPVTYQHGRYFIPAMPAFFVLGLAGLATVIQKGHIKIWQRVLIKSWILSIILVVAGFLILGARSYATDVAIIETEMVQTAKWLRDNTQKEDILAIHDIGAAGYFSERRVIDLAGLVSPEVVPFIRDENQIAGFLDQRNVDYLVTFPGWYPKLVQSLQVVYRTGGKYAPAAGGENMAVYKWRKR